MKAVLLLYGLAAIGIFELARSLGIGSAAEILAILAGSSLILGAVAWKTGSRWPFLTASLVEIPWILLMSALLGAAGALIILLIATILQASGPNPSAQKQALSQGVGFVITLVLAWLTGIGERIGPSTVARWFVSRRYGNRFAAMPRKHGAELNAYYAVNRESFAVLADSKPITGWGVSALKHRLRLIKEAG